jgi:hypothetical protein
MRKLLRSLGFARDGDTTSVGVKKKGRFEGKGSNLAPADRAVLESQRTNVQPLGNLRIIKRVGQERSDL